MYKLDQVVIERIPAPSGVSGEFIDTRVHITHLSHSEIQTSSGRVFNRYGIATRPYASIRALSFEHAERRV